MTAFSAKLYLTPNANWKQSNARFAAYFFGNGETWISMTKVAGETDLYEVEAPAGYPNVIFCRMNPSASANNWNNKWNQTADLKVPTNTQNHYTVKEGTWDKGGGTWTVYAPEAPKTYKDITITIIANAQPKIHYWEGGDKMVGSDWDSKPDMIATAEANTYSYTIKDVDEAIGVKYLIVVGDIQSVDLHTIDNVTANFKDCLPQVAVMGVNNWDGTDKMVVADDYKTASITLNLIIKDYAWKLTVNGEWFGGSKYVITRDKNSLNVTDDAGGDGKLTADIAGEYVFTYTYATKNLTVTYPATSVEPDPEPTTYTIYFDNTNSAWEKVYAYCWNGEGESAEANGEWPGVELTNPAENVYTYATTKSYENVIFTNGDGMQTPDLVFENGKTYIFVPVVATWTVVGSSEVLFGAAWDTNRTENDLVLGEENIWSKVYTNVELAEGTIEYKVVKNHSFDEAYPSENAKLEVATAGKYNVIFTFNAETKEVSAVLESVGGPSVDVENTIISNIYTFNGTVMVDGEFQIFTITGQNVTNMNGNLENGVYVVRTANTIVKVVVK